MSEILIGLAIPAAQVAGLVLLGLLFRTDRPKRETADCVG